MKFIFRNTMKEVLVIFLHWKNITVYSTDKEGNYHVYIIPWGRLFKGWCRTP